MKKREYLHPSIRVIEAESQQPIAASNVSGLNANPWESDSGDGIIEDN